MDIHTRLNCTEVKGWDLVDFLSGIGVEPKKIRRNDYWYLSPLRIEKTPSFKVARKLNVWYDHGIGKGGTIIDFCCLYFNCTVEQALEKMADTVSFRQPVYQPQNLPQKEEESPLRILRVGPIQSFPLVRYLHSRNIPLEIAKHYTKEVSFSLYDKEHKAIGFRNDTDGYELRNHWFKGSSLPKGVTTIKNRSKEAVVLEGFFDFLSYCKIFENHHLSPPDFVILNSASFFEKSLSLLDTYKQVSLYLDLDNTGRKYTAMALDANKNVTDESAIYTGYKDLNDWHCHFGKGQKVNRGQRL